MVQFLYMKKISQLALVNFSDITIPKKTLQALHNISEKIIYVETNDVNFHDSIKNIDAIICKIFSPIDKLFIEAAPQLKYIGVFATDFSTIDIQHASTKNITVTNGGDYSATAVAEFIIASILEKERELSRAQEHVRNDDFSFNTFMGSELKNKTFGVIGAGRIGSRVLKIANGFGMNTFYFSRSEKAALKAIDAEFTSLEKIAKQSDYIAITIALNKETEGLIDENIINSMKNNATIVNVVPNEIIHHESFIQKLYRDTDSSFISDHLNELKPKVFSQYQELPNVITYPPIAFRTKEADMARWNILTKNIKGFIDGQPQNVVN